MPIARLRFYCFRVQSGKIVFPSFASHERDIEARSFHMHLSEPNKPPLGCWQVHVSVAKVYEVSLISGCEKVEELRLDRPMAENPWKM